METDNRLFYLRTADRTPVGAVAFTLNSPQEEFVRALNRLVEANNLSAKERAAIEANAPEVETPGVRFTVTLCHPSDQFVKKIGRAKTLGRLQSFDASIFAAPQWENAGAPPITIAELLSVLGLPAREEIDYERMDALLYGQLRAAYKRAGFDPGPYENAEAMKASEDANSTGVDDAILLH